MTLLVLGISHRSAPMSVLDALALDATGVDALLGRAREGKYVGGATVLATCNRLELIADVEAFHGGLADLGSALVEAVGLPWDELAHHVYVYFDTKAMEHLLTLAAGLDSMALGEAQILGQLRQSFTSAQESGALTGDLSRALQEALRVGKRAHSETALDSVSQSLLDTALAAAVPHIGPLEQANALVVGAGAMSGLTVATLHRAGVARITVINRTLERAERLVAPVGGRAITLDEESLAREIADADLVVSVTGSRGTVLGQDQIIAGMQQDLDAQPNKFLIDLALPHDIAPDVEELPHIRLLGLEDLSAMFADTGHRTDSDVVSVITEVRGIIRTEMESLAAHREARRIAPTVSALRSQAEATVDSEYARLEKKLAGKVDERALAEIRKAMARAVDKIIHTPTVKVKELSAGDSEVDYAAALTTLFDLSAKPKADGIDRSKVAVSAPGVPPVTARNNHYIPADGLRPVADHTLDVIEPAKPTGRTLRLGTRRSMLARSQSTAIAQQIAAQTGWRVEIVEVVTEGDVNMNPLAQMGGTGVFVSGVRTALLTGKIDVAVHSLKDLPTAPAPGIELAAVPPRVDPSDVLIARDGLALSELPAGSIVGTGSPRRAAQLRAARPDIEVRGVRGNVDTRIRHVTEGRIDGVVLAAAGIRRLGRLAEVTDVIDSSVMLPAPGQGALAIECRSVDSDLGEFDAEVRRALDSIHDEATALAVMCERAVLSRAEAGCSAPIGALAQIDGHSLSITGVMADDAGRLQRVSRMAGLPRRSAEVTRAEVRHAARSLGADTADEMLSALGITIGGSAGTNAPSEHVDPRTPASVGAAGETRDGTDD
ncbi:glutamyl-tRNA reductase [Brevibacterium pityocampae]|uniref:Multifunctional fusion protein n=1 Tax=Brevibacterium pityocampae TaxID=506594 RepID=A0ABP8J665_9MICO